MSDKMTALEIQIAYLEDEVLTLTRALINQERALQEMRHSLQLLAQRLDVKGQDDIAPFDLIADRPPHY